MKIADTQLAGLTARAVLVLDENDRVLHAELVSDITHEPDYDAALAALRNATARQEPPGDAALSS